MDQSPDGCLTSRYSWSVVLDPDTSAKITRYRPREAPPTWEDVAPLVRSVVAATVTAVPYDVERLLHAVAGLALWAEANGLPRDPDSWLRGEVIDAFVLSRAGVLAPTSVQTYRTWLRRVRDALAWTDRGEPVPPKLHAPANPHEPYSSQELAGLRHWASHLRGQQRTDALALMGLGAGFRLMPRELAATRGRDLRRPRAGHPLIHAGIRRTPVAARAQWEEELAELAELAGGNYLFRPRRTTPYAKNLIGSWSLLHQPSSGLPPLSVGRLRAGWIVELMCDRIDHDLIAKAAGRASAASLARYQHLVPPLDDATAIRLLRGRPA
ncbi:hypothetical protein C7C46_10005 [Streptomyces tateyamensis]|uniref:Site-specific integrase n=1 Tax=Streptomyces tateyamensis TaxID=565073 RepID=A0A2V4NZQ8_9ACTN|nr:hypothetical protein C7C46_10005 [Streptomyces tateyamensis]